MVVGSGGAGEEVGGRAAGGNVLFFQKLQHVDQVVDGGHLLELLPGDKGREADVIVTEDEGIGESLAILFFELIFVQEDHFVLSVPAIVSPLFALAYGAVGESAQFAGVRPRGHDFVNGVEHGIERAGFGIVDEY